jgi:glycosyltransferase involved in cell wall biosynthesis
MNFNQAAGSATVVNARILAANLTGVQRYLSELLIRMPQVSPIAPPAPIAGVKGHLWEQFTLPRLTRGSLLWSPSNTGPLSVRKQLLTLHDVVPLDHPEWLNWKFAAWYRWLTPKLVHRVAHVITDSEFTKSRILDLMGVDPDKISVIPCGVDSRFKESGEAAQDAMRQELGIPTKSYVLSLGSLEPRKNLGRLLAAWETVVDKLPEEIWLVLAGTKGKSTVFRDVQFAKMPKRVYLAGRIPDELIVPLYSAALAFAYLSVYEGFGIPPLEAMACGAPVIVGNGTSIPEVVGDAGIQVDPFSVEAIADGLRQIVESSSLRKNLIEKGLNRAKLFSWDNAAADTWNIIERVSRDH